MEEERCEKCGRRIPTRCSFCEASLEFPEWKFAKEPVIYLDIAFALPVDQGWDVDELTACPACARRFLTKEAMEEIKKISFV